MMTCLSLKLCRCDCISMFHQSEGFRALYSFSFDKSWLQIAILNNEWWSISATCSTSDGYFTDAADNKCKQCHANCKTCDGSAENDCLSCKTTAEGSTLIVHGIDHGVTDSGKCLSKLWIKKFDNQIYSNEFASHQSHIRLLCTWRRGCR